MVVVASGVVNTFLGRAGGVAKEVYSSRYSPTILLSGANVRRTNIVNVTVFRAVRPCIIKAQSRSSAVRLNHHSTSFTSPQETESSPFMGKMRTGGSPYFQGHETLPHHYGGHARLLPRLLPRRRGARHTTSRRPDSVDDARRGVGGSRGRGAARCRRAPADPFEPRHGRSR